jgi:hypothetical protein
MAPGGAGKGKGGGNQVFGQTMKKKSTPSSRYQKQAGNNYQSKQTVYKSAADTDDAATDPAVARRRFKQQQGQEIDKLFGYEKFALSNNNNNEPNSASRRGWLFQMLATTVRNDNDYNKRDGGVAILSNEPIDVSVKSIQPSSSPPMAHSLLVLFTILYYIV